MNHVERLSLVVPVLLVPFFFTFIFNLVPLLLFIQPNFNGMEGRMSGMEARIWLSEKNKEEPHTNSSFYSSSFD